MTFFALELFPDFQMALKRGTFTKLSFTNTKVETQFVSDVVSSKVALRIQRNLAVHFCNVSFMRTPFKTNVKNIRYSVKKSDLKVHWSFFNQGFTPK